MADCRWQSPDAMRSAAWHYEGKQFMSSHVDGSLITWTLRQPKPINVSYPHGKYLHLHNILLQDKLIIYKMVHKNVTLKIINISLKY